MIAEHLRARRDGDDQGRQPRKHKRRPQPTAAPESDDAVTPCRHETAFHRKRGKFKPSGQAEALIPGSYGYASNV
jgi:hypothetical protein